ncbi:MAG: hypothetical protein HC835_01285 [Oscillatoriales cyanobacterium RM2_1_1]|nr:hypothetical protein [Oscillatoriales cyanobacterium SM2_3_0]NJO44368.1 hypothetical protein [Oscillatoriales cyanobacterium RM2_1_1]
MQKPSEKVSKDSPGGSRGIGEPEALDLLGSFLDSEETATSYHQGQPFMFGEMPIVKNRFEAVIKRRLKAEILQNPPLFPWETQAEFATYPDVLMESQVPDLISNLVPNTGLWSAHQRNLRWSMPLPETVFAQLLNPCFDLLQSSLREGKKLIKAVETLFPDQSEPLNQLASLVVLGPVRTPLSSESQPCYQDATSDQQMVMLLLAAQEILQALTLDCPLNQAPVRQQWLTNVGVLTVEAEYVSETWGTTLKVLGHLPDGGRLLLIGEGTETVAQRQEQGYLKLELVNPQPNQVYRLNVLLHNEEQHPLSFAICPQMSA